jgi:Family of unknown function (DUF6221)
VGLIPFMNARLAEVEAVAKAAQAPSPWKAATHEADSWIVTDADGEPLIYNEGTPTLEEAVHIALHDPGRELREVAAKRARLALMIEATEEMDRLIADDDANRSDQAMAIGRCRAATVAVKCDAAIWNDHPDYQQKKWAP